jgi:hypothetical protein
MWPGVTSLPDYKAIFPQWAPKDLETSIDNMTPVAADMLNVRSGRLTGLTLIAMAQGMLVYDPAKRISAKAALQHPYFRA